MADFNAYVRGIISRLEGILTQERNQTHGNAEENFQLIADYWGMYLDRRVTKEDVCIMMCLLKVARISEGDKENPDHLLDMAGYSILSLAMKEKENI
tara:strand:+ start:197 stop:487 length:291 start_codon:yes stop_codon:yes gene_type:complete